MGSAAGRSVIDADGGYAVDTGGGVVAVMHKRVLADDLHSLRGRIMLSGWSETQV